MDIVFFIFYFFGSNFYLKFFFSLNFLSIMKFNIKIKYKKYYFNKIY